MKITPANDKTRHIVAALRSLDDVISSLKKASAVNPEDTSFKGQINQARELYLKTEKSLDRH